VSSFLTAAHQHN